MRIVVDGDVEIVTEKRKPAPKRQDDDRLKVVVFGALLLLCGVALWLS